MSPQRPTLTFRSLCLVLALMAGPALASGSAGTGGYVSLEGVEEFRGVVDLSHGEPATVLRYLQLVAQMDEDLKEMGLDRRIVVAMRGGAVRYLRSDRSPIPHADQIVAEEIADAVAALDARHIRIEACKVAMDRFEVPVDGVLEAVNVVDNTFITLIGFQQQGYGLVAIP
ncbi:DsrE family protein [Thioalkalivibrio thiocyanodenitrificans]|uniref:DsrE family protein n=1 Tax=Thioalkalivibrio thiocyanodenitrificans TaxID=243063 RepID=UPI000380E52F|nr:DsrE family protein [Thioalkalivibrio thiocyanodenitrificans]